MKYDEVPRPRGFAAMTPERRREIARLGGIAGHKMGGRAHVWDHDQAVTAGRKGGAISRRKPKIALENDKS